MYERLAPAAFDSLDEVPSPSETLRLVGHLQARDALTAAYNHHKLHHALLLTGPVGIGKATFAFQFASGILGLDDALFQQRDPQSQLYRQIATGAHPGLLYLSRPFDEKTKKFRAVITADEIRKINRFLSMRTHDGGYRVIIIDPADDMNRSAANALLKSLEEPPEKVLFILISHSPGALLPTIRSRAQTFKLQPLSDEELFQAVAPITQVPEGSARTEIAYRASGSPRAALTLSLHGGLDIADATDDVISSRAENHVTASKLAEAVSGKDAGMQFDFFNDYVLQKLAQTASSSGAAGDLTGAARAAEAWQNVSERVRELESYNLDKKQHVLSLLQTLQAQLTP